MIFAFYTLGCKVNQYETQAMEQELLRRGRGAVMGLLEEVGYEEYICPEDEAAFQNVNTMDDYEAMKQ